MTLLSQMRSPVVRRVMVGAFVVQVVAILLCLATALKIYHEFEGRLNRQIAVQQRQAEELAKQSLVLGQRERDLRDAEDALSRAYFNRGIELSRVGRFSDAAGTLSDGLKVAPADAYMRRELVKALIHSGDPQAALRTALGPRGNSAITPRDLVTIALARCATGDAPDALALLTTAKVVAQADADVMAICPAEVTRAAVLAPRPAPTAK